MKKIILLLLFILSSFNVFPRNFNYTSGSHAIAIGNAFVSKKDASSAFNNPAGLSDLKNIYLSSVYENRFLNSDLNSLAIGFVIPTKSGNFAFIFNNIGISPRSKTKISAAYSKKLSQSLSAGIQLNCFLSNFSENYNVSTETGIELGLIYEIDKKSSLGIHVSNPYNINLSNNYTNSKNYSLRIGGHHNYNETLIVSFEVENFNVKEFNFKAGIESKVSSGILLRGGFNTNEFSLFGGIGFKKKNYTIELASALYPRIGICPSLTLTYIIK